MNDNNYIAHHGIKGQKWGVEHGPPYPVRRGSGGKPKTTNVIKSKLKENIAKRSAKRAEKKEESAEEKHEKLKAQLIRNPKDLYRFKGEFSRSELESMIKDIEFDRKLRDIRIEEVKRGLDRAARVKDGMNTAYNILNSSKNIYNIIADVNNAFVDSGKSKGKRLVKLGEKPNDQQKKDDSNK